MYEEKKESVSPFIMTRRSRRTMSEMPFSNDLWKFFGIQFPEIEWNFDEGVTVDMGREFNSGHSCGLARIESNE